MFFFSDFRHIYPCKKFLGFSNFLFFLIILCGLSPCRSPGWSGGHVAWALLGDASTCSVDLLNPHSSHLIQFIRIRHFINEICELRLCCSVLYMQHLLHVCPSWERDPSSVATPEVSSFFFLCEKRFPLFFLT